MVADVVAQESFVCQSQLPEGMAGEFTCIYKAHFILKAVLCVKDNLQFCGLTKYDVKEAEICVGYETDPGLDHI